MRRFHVQFILAAACFLFMAGVAAADIELSFRFNDAEQKELRAALDVFEKQNHPKYLDQVTRILKKDGIFCGSSKLPGNASIALVK